MYGQSAGLFDIVQSCTECENNCGVEGKDFVCKIHGLVDGDFAETCEDFM